jgi:uncharacterized protein (UPF0335 family)
VLERIEELEEREDLLSEILPEMEARGHDTGTVKAVLGG